MASENVCSGGVSRSRLDAYYGIVLEGKKLSYSQKKKFGNDCTTNKFIKLTLLQQLNPVFLMHPLLLASLYQSIARAVGVTLTLVSALASTLEVRVKVLYVMGGSTVIAILFMDRSFVTICESYIIILGNILNFRARLFKTNNVVSKRFVKFSEVYFSNMPIFFVEKM